MWAPAARSRRVARVALALALIGTVLVLAPFGRVFSGPVLVAASITAIVALASKRQGSKGVAASALIVSIVMSLGSIALFVSSLFGGAAGTSDDEYEYDEPVIEQPYADVGAEIPLIESGIGAEEWDPSAAWFAAVFDTPASHAGTPFLDVTVEALDASGAVIETAAEYIQDPSGRIAVSGTFYDLGTREVASIVVRTGEASTLPASGISGTFSFGAVSAATDGGVTTATGTIRSTFGTAQPYVRVVVLARDAGGRIIDVANTWLEDVPAGREAPLEVDFYNPHPPGTTYEAFASL